MTTYGFKKNKCREEVYTKEEAVGKEDIVVLRGSVTTAAKSEEETIHYNTYTLDFPDGFNKDNCVCLAFGISTAIDTVQGFSYEILDPSESRSWLRSSLYRNIILGENHNLGKISMTIGTPYSEEFTVRYKIVLMKHEVSDDTYTLGDVNGDGKIDSLDTEMITQYTLGNIALTEQQLKAGDVNKDGLTDMLDATIITQYINGTIDSLE